MATWSVTADIDALLDNSNPDTNYETGVQLEAGVIITGEDKTSWWRSILNFDLSGFPGASGDITSAKLTIYVNGIVGSGWTVRFERCTRPFTWVEAEVTWNDYSTGNAWTASGGDLTQTDRASLTTPGGTPPVWVDVTGFKDLVIDAIDNRSDILSFIARQDDEAVAGSTRRLRFTSSELATKEPILEITYTVAGAALPERSYPRGVGRGVERGVA